MTCAQFFVTPLGTIGENLSQFFAGTMKHVPAFLWPIVILLILFIVIIFSLMYSRYEIHLPFMLGSFRPSPHVSISTSTKHVEKIENSSDSLKDYVSELENKIQQLRLELDERKHSIEHDRTSSMTRSSRYSFCFVYHSKKLSMFFLFFDGI